MKRIYNMGWVMIQLAMLVSPVVSRASDISMTTSYAYGYSSASESWVSISLSNAVSSVESTTTVTGSIASTAGALPPRNDTTSDELSTSIQSRTITLNPPSPPGDIDIADSIAPTNDLYMPFGDVIAGFSRTEQIRVYNDDPTNTLLVTEVATSALDILLLVSGPEPTRMRSALEAFPDINTADYFNCSFAVPTASLLSNYNAVVAMSAYVFYDASQTGNILADYVDGGGHVVQTAATFANVSGFGLAGRFASGGYGPFIPGHAEVFAHSLGAYVAGHPVMEGVNLLSDSYPVSVGGLQPSAEWVADWNNGTPLVAIAASGVVGINIFVADYGDYSGDVARLFHNALQYTAASGFSLENLPSFPYSVPPDSNLVFDVVYAPEYVRSNTVNVIIDSNDADEPKVVVALSGSGILDYLGITPESGFTTSGHPGGPFSPATQEYDLQNNGTHPLHWQAFANEPWVSITPSSGTLSTSASTTVTIGLSAAAGTLPEGSFSDTVTFSNLTTGIAQSREVLLDVFTTPQIIVNPIEGFVVTNQPGETQIRTLMVSNARSADGSLDFVIRTIETGRNEALATQQTEQTAVASGNTVTESATGAEYKPGRLLVRFAPNLKIAEQHAKASALGGNIRRRFSLVPGLCVVELGNGTNVKRSLKSFKNSPSVMHAQPDYMWHADAEPNDTSFNSLWGMHNTGQTGGTYDADIDAPEAWDVTVGNHGIIVAVIDTGVDYTHPDLNDNMWTNPGEIPGNGLDDDSNGFVDDVHGYDFVNDDGDPMDDYYHGTHVAGTVGAEGSNGEGVAGVCWDVSIMALKFLNASGYGSTVDAIASIEYATQMGAKVMSNSWGGGPYDQALKDAIDAAGALGITFVAAAGNDGQNNDSTPAYPSNFDSDNLIAVISSDQNDAKSSFSNYGLNSTDLAAPGSRIYSCALGGGYRSLSGTSMATPHVAGACALLLSINPYLTASEIRQILIETVDPSLPGSCVSGGRLNIARAVANASATWMRVEPAYTNGVVPGASINASVYFDAADLGPGSYTGEVLVACNDPFTPSVTLPAIMVVGPYQLDHFEWTPIAPTQSVGWAFAVMITAMDAHSNIVDGFFGEVNLSSKGSPVTISPSDTDAFFEGVWSGYLTVMEAATNLVLTADEEAGHMGESNPFSVFIPVADQDEDGIPDWWENLYFGAPSICIWYNDDDGDGQNNRDEYIAGTDPSDDASQFAITGFGKPVDADYFVIDWLSITGRYYNVNWTTNLQEGFELLEGNLEYPQNSYTDILYSAESEVFYNVEVHLK